MLTKIGVFVNAIYISMATIKLSLSTKIDLDSNKSEIYFRFSGGRQFTKRIKTRILIDKRRWSEKECRIIIPRLKSAESDEVRKIAKKVDALGEYLISEFENQYVIDP
jgi:hypothetical protein